MSDLILTKATRDGRTVEVRLVAPDSVTPQFAISLDGVETVRAGCVMRSRQPKGDVTHYMGANGVAVGFTAGEARTLEAALAAARREGTRKAREGAEAALRERHAALFERARATGIPQTIETWMQSCDLPDCSQDAMSLLAMPDGTTRTHRTHTH